MATISNSTSDTIIVGTKDNDFIENSGDSVTINAAAGDDDIFNVGSNVSISGGAGDDYVKNSGSNVSISGGNGNDIIKNSENVKWNSATQQWETLSSADNTTISGGAGNDTIGLWGAYLKNTLIQYSEGDGNDTVEGYHSNATLRIGDGSGTYSSFVNGDDVIINVGNGSITLKDAKDKTLNIDGEEREFEPAAWTLNGTTATCEAADKTTVTVEGVKSASGLILSGNRVIVSAASLGTQKVTVSNGYTLALGDDVKEAEVEDAEWTLKKNTATLSRKQSAGYVCDGDSITYSTAKTTTLATLTGVKSVDGLYFDNDDNVIRVYDEALGSATIKLTKGDYKLELISDLAAEVEEPQWSLKKNTATLSQKQSVGYVCNGGSITYLNKAATATLATLTGVQSVDGLSVDGNVITLSEYALGSATVKLTKGNYKLELGDDVATEPTTEPTWFISGTKATYKNGNSAYYSLASNGKSVNFVKAAADKKAKDLITLSGINKNFTANDVEIDEDNMVVTLSNNALNKKNVTIGGSEDYSLALGDDVTEAEVEDAKWSLKKTTATLSQKQSVGYVCNGSSITYSSKAATATLATLTGVQSVDGLSVDGNVITLSEDALGSATVKLTKGNYKLELGDGVATEPTTEPTWFISGTKATYKDGNSAYYSLASNGKSVNFVKAASDKKAKDLITLSGVNKNFTADDVEIDEAYPIVTLYNHALNKKNITIGGSEDYSLALGDDVPEVTLGDLKLDVKGSKASLTQSTSVGYRLTNDNKTITYSKKASATTIATINGVKSKSGISIDTSFIDPYITLSNSALTNKVTVSGDAHFEFDANYKNASITGSKNDDNITVLGTGVSVTGGKGDDFFTSGGGNTFVYASGDGDDFIVDFTSNDKLKVTSGTVKVDTEGNNVIVSVTKGKVTGSITLYDAAGQNISILDSKNNRTVYPSSASDYWFNENVFDTDNQISMLANISETKNQIAMSADVNEMNNRFDSLNNEKTYLATFSNKK